MSKLMRASVILTAAMLASAGARADVWDVNTQSDNEASTTRNELMHGSSQVHDLPLVGLNPDRDHYLIGQRPQSSWEVLVDGMSGDTATAGLTLERLSAAGTVAQTSASVTTTLNLAQSLRWENTNPSTVLNETIKITSASCTTNCTYRTRAFETTYAIPRFNNSATQTTFVFVQNTASYSISGRMYFWTDAGTLGATVPFTAAPKQLVNVNPNNTPSVANKAGSITIGHNGRYGDLAGKAVALEPSTGFAFDTMMVHRAN